MPDSRTVTPRPLLALGVIVLGALLIATSAAQVAPTPAPDPADIRRALQSIRVHANPRVFGDSPAGVLSLDAAAQIIAEIGSPTGPYRQRHAIVNLSLGRFDRDGFPEDVEAALEILDAPVGGIVETMRSLPRDASRAAASQALFTLLAKFDFGESCASWVTTDAGYDAVTDSALAAFHITGVPRGLGKVAQALDPQNWKQCFAPWITESVVAQPGSASNCAPAPSQSPPPPATTWKDTLFERWENPSIGVDWLRNYFNIEAQRSSTTYFYGYDLDFSCDMNYAGTVISDPMRRNQGFMSAHSQGGMVAVTGLKVLQYSPDAYAESGQNFNMSAPYFLHDMGESVEIAVCTCEPGTPSSITLLMYDFLEWFFSFFSKR